MNEVLIETVPKQKLSPQQRVSQQPNSVRRHHKISSFFLVGLRVQDSKPEKKLLEQRWQQHQYGVSYIIIRVFCVCVCVCVCQCVCVSVQPEISGMGGRIAMLFIPSWRALPGKLHKLLFKPIRRMVWKKKPLQVFRQLHAEFPCTHCYISGYSGQDESYPLLDLCWMILEGHTSKDMPTTSRVP